MSDVNKHEACETCPEQHEHKVYESRIRSLLKRLTAHTIKFVLDFSVFEAILNFIIRTSPAMSALNKALGSVVLALIVEGIDFIIEYFNERGWNRIQWQRKIIDIN